MSGPDHHGPPGRARDRPRRIRSICLALIGLLYVGSVPWYRADDAPLRLWLGLPDWVAVALLCYVGVAVLNALAWSATEVVDPEEEPETVADREAAP